MPAPQTPFNQWVAITPSDTADLAARTEAIYVGGAGDVAAVMGDGTAATFKAVAVGTILPLAVRRINATNTTATLLLGLRTI